MKKILGLLLLGIASIAQSQVIIGDEEGTATDKTSVLLEFANTGEQGIILPYVTTLPAEVGGTIVLDATDTTAARVKYYDAVNTAWVDLSGQDGDITDELTAMSQPDVTEDGMAIIGATSSDADGVLVLESTTQAMVLPWVASTDDVPSPAAGMMVYINATDAKRLAVFNGTTWSYWKP